MIRTIIVDDDPMVAEINGQYLTQMGNFSINGIFPNGEAALDYLRANPVELVLLDVYMPGLTGSDLLRQMRAEGILSDVIIITAAAEVRVVSEAVGLGVVDYLIKPYSLSRFQEAVSKYLSKANLLKSSDKVDQRMVDRLLGSQRPKEQGELRKGVNQKTMDLVLDALRQDPEAEYTCEGLSASSGLSKVTVRRYLNYLIETGQIQSSIDYETGGRPRVLYRLEV